MKLSFLSAGSGTRTALQYITGASLLALCGVLLWNQGLMIRDTRAATLPVAADIPVLQHRTRVLEQEVTLGQDSAAARAASEQEKRDIFVLPVHPDHERVLSLLDFLQARTQTDAAKVELGEPRQTTVEGMPAEEQEIRMQFSATVASLESITQLLHVTGLLTVADALSAEQIRNLVSVIEAKNPANIVALEQFLSTDLLAYTQQSQQVKDRLFTTVADEDFTAIFATVHQSSLLPLAEETLGGKTGEELSRAKLWPLPLVDIRSLTVSTLPGDKKEVKLTLVAYGRGEERIEN